MMSMPYIERDVSWLSFNHRVLQEAKDPTVPLLERIKFLAIYSSNLDEFFRIRIANHRNLIRVGKKTQKELHYLPRETLLELLLIVKSQQEEFTKIFEDQIQPELKAIGIRILRWYETSEVQNEFIDSYFQENMLPFVQPVLLVKDKIRPFLNNAALYLIIQMISKEKGEKWFKKDIQYAIVKIPSDHLPRFIELPPEGKYKHDIILIDDVVRHHISWLFPGYNLLDSHSIKLTRDAELYIDDEYSGDLIEKIKNSLNKRNVGPASRLVYDRDMDPSILVFLKEMFKLNSYDTMPEGRYHNNSDFFKFPDFGMTHYLNPPLPPLEHPRLADRSKKIFEIISDKDQLVMYPFQSYDPVVRYFEEAAEDPDVTHIKIIQYRVARKSKIMNALMRAVELGKHVSAFIEVKARFDEEANLRWGEKLEAAGINVQYSFPGLKVHAKVGLVRRIQSDGPKIYTYFSTGNFHEDTAKVYSDFGLFTADTRLTSEAARLFAYLETVKKSKDSFEHLLVGQFNLRPELERLIANEVAAAKAGNKAEILLKLNSLQDQKMIKLLYNASQAGVEVKLIIRGICCIVPGVKKVSENITAISIVDRFLEHARVFSFYNGGDQKLYLSSADWMVRNLSHRIETTVPVYDEDLKKMIYDVLQIQLNDNVKARYLGEEKHNTYKSTGSDMAIRSQIETYYYFRRLIEK